MGTRDEQLDFIQRNLAILADFASAGYQAEGRGFVLVGSDAHDPLATVAIGFVPANEVCKFIRDWNTCGEKRLVTQYEPALEMVVLFFRMSGKSRIDYDSYRCRFMAPSASTQAAKP